MHKIVIKCWTCLRYRNIRKNIEKEEKGAGTIKINSSFANIVPSYEQYSSGLRGVIKVLTQLLSNCIVVPVTK